MTAMSLLPLLYVPSMLFTPRPVPSAMARQMPMAHVPRTQALEMCMGGSNSDDEQWSPSDESALFNHIRSKSSSAKVGRPSMVMNGMDGAYVLIFNPGRHDEGVYTLQGKQTPTAAYVLAFEQTDDADRFAELLQAEGFDLATPLRWDISTLTAFCDAGDFEVSLVPTGGLLTPPAKNEYDLDAFNRLKEEGALKNEPTVDPAVFAAERAALERLFRGEGGGEGSNGNPRPDGGRPDGGPRPDGLDPPPWQW